MAKPKNLSLDKTITFKEIMELLGISKSAMFELRHAINSEMPAPINSNSKYLLYDRETMMVWIKQQIANRQTKPVKPGLDNELAKEVLRRDFPWVKR